LALIQSNPEVIRKLKNDFESGSARNFDRINKIYRINPNRFSLIPKPEFLCLGITTISHDFNITSSNPEQS